MNAIIVITPLYAAAYVRGIAAHTTSKQLTQLQLLTQAAAAAFNLQSQSHS